MTVNSFTQNFVWASPNGSAGAPVMRALVATDIPTTGPFNIASTSSYQIGGTSVISYGGGSNSFNLAIGPGTLSANTTAIFNTAIGYGSLGACTTGGSNIGIGVGALSSVTTGAANFGIGQSAGNSLTTGTGNLCLGVVAGQNITTGQSNIAIGYNIQFANATASGQINIGGLFFGTGATYSGSGAPGGGNAGIATNSPRCTLDVAGPSATVPTTVSSLPSASSMRGARHCVTDATEPYVAGYIGTVVVGGGGNTVPVFSNGGNWVIG